MARAKNNKAKYYKVWDKENGKYKGIWRIAPPQIKMNSLFRYEELSEEMELYYETLRQEKILKGYIN